jgi:hypothetical protein
MVRISGYGESALCGVASWGRLHYIDLLMNKKFHKPINRLVFYGYFGITMANIRTFISTPDVISCSKEPLRQFQGFFIQTYDLKVRTASH